MWFVVCGLMVAGCSHPDFASAKPAGNVFRVPLDVTMMSLDPALVSDNWSIDTIQNTFEGLVAMGEDNQVHSCLAESWEVSGDGKTYTFHLKRGVLFHNLREVKAEDFAKSLERSCSKALAAPLAADYLNDIVGMAAFHSGEASTLAGVRVLGPYTLAISLNEAHPYFIAKLSLPVAAVVATEAIKDGIHVRSIDEMVGTGPFQITKYADGQMLVQKAFDRYHGGRPRIDAIERPVMRDAAERLSAFKRGEVDAIQLLTRSDYADLTKDPKYGPMLRLVPRATLVYLGLNVSTYPDRRVRQAIAMAIDRDVIANDYLFGTVTPAKGILPPGIPGYRNEPHWLGLKVDAARRLLDESGHRGGAGLPELRISFAMENPDIERIADQIGSQLKATLGINVRLERLETGTLIAKQNRKELASEVTGWFADYVDPEDFLSMLLTTDTPENHWNYSNPDYDALCREADACTDANLRLKLYAKAEDLTLQDAVLIPICYWKTPTITSPRVHGVRSYAAQFLPYNSVWIDP